VPLRDGRDAGRHRRGKERGLPLAGRRFQDGFEVLRESHVEHLVGLVEHEKAHGIEPQRAAADVIQRPARRGDDHVDAAFQSPDLLAHCRSAVNRGDLHSELSAVPVDRLGDLHRELARRHQHEPRRAAARAGLLRDPLQHR
jgi:hypothetical protein